MLKRVKKLVHHKGSKNKLQGKHSSSMFWLHGDPRAPHCYDKPLDHGNINNRNHNNNDCFSINNNVAIHDISHNSNEPLGDGHGDKVAKTHQATKPFGHDLEYSLSSPRSNRSKNSSENSNELDYRTEKSSNTKKRQMKFRLHKSKKNKGHQKSSLDVGFNLSRRQSKSTPDLTRHGEQENHFGSTSNISSTNSSVALRQKRVKNNKSDSVTAPSISKQLKVSSPSLLTPKVKINECDDEINDNSKHINRQSISYSGRSSRTSVTSMEALRESRRSVISYLDGYINNLNSNDNLANAPSRLCCALLLRSVYQTRERQCQRRRPQNHHKDYHLYASNSIQHSQSDCNLVKANEHSQVSENTGSLQDLTTNKKPSITNGVIENGLVNVLLTPPSPTPSHSVFKCHQGATDSDDSSCFSSDLEQENFGARNYKKDYLFSGKTYKNGDNVLSNSDPENSSNRNDNEGEMKSSSICGSRTFLGVTVNCTIACTSKSNKICNQNSKENHLQEHGVSLDDCYNRKFGGSFSNLQSDEYSKDNLIKHQVSNDINMNSRKHKKEKKMFKRNRKSMPSFPTSTADMDIY